MASGGQIAWTKNAWGTASTTAAPEAVLKEGDEECTICRDKAVTTHFKPCGHGSCIDCVESLRASTIFKADRGLKCPYCRQYIEGYESRGGDHSTQRALQEANQAARAAALAREPAPRQQALRPNRASSTGEGAGSGLNDWTCMRCGKVNAQTRAVCAKPGCPQEAPPFIQYAISAARNPVDLLKIPKETIVKWAYIKLHPNLDSAFKDAGMPFTGKVEGSETTITDAVLKNQHAKLLHVVSVLVEEGEIPKLALDFFGNYMVQDLLEATKKLRDVVRQLQKMGKLTGQKAAAAGGMKDDKDALGQIVAQVAPISTQAALHNSGQFVLQKVMIVADSAELLPVAESLITRCMDICLSKHGIHVMIKIVDKLRWLAFEATEAAKLAANLLDDLLGVLTAEGSAKKFMTLAHSFFGGQIIVEAIQGALPLLNAQNAAQMLASEALILTGSRPGVNTLKALLGLTALDVRSKDLIGANCCIIAQSLENHFASVAVNAFQGYTLVRRLLEILTEDTDETSKEWVRSIVASLVLQVGTLQESDAAYGLIPFGLSLPALSEQEVFMHVQTLGALLGQAAAADIAVTVFKARHPGAPVPGLGPQMYHAAPTVPGHSNPASTPNSRPVTPPPPPPPPRTPSPALSPTSHPQTMQAPQLHFGDFPELPGRPMLPNGSGMDATANHSASASSHGGSGTRNPSTGQTVSEPSDVLSDLLNLAPMNAALPQVGSVASQASRHNNAAANGVRPSLPQPMPFRPPQVVSYAPRPISAGEPPPAANVGPPPPATLMNGTEPTSSSAQSSTTAHFMAKLQESVSKQAAGQRVGKKAPKRVESATEVATAPVAAAPTSESRPAWTCTVCTYVNAGKEVDYLFCAMCSLPRET